MSVLQLVHLSAPLEWPLRNDSLFQEGGEAWENRPASLCDQSGS